METPYLITERWEYDMVKSKGYEPLIDSRHFEIEINLRIEIQKELFGHCTHGRADDIQKANERFYRWCWEHNPHICEETMRPLREYSAVYISHILTRGAYPEMAHDPRNINILCFDMHNKWENGKREEMRIYERNQETILKLKKEYEQANCNTQN